jgi:hypothetical protein
MAKLLWYQWTALIALGICLFILLLHFIRLISLGKPKDLSRPSGSTTKGIFFAFTRAMSPARKESAYLHLPTYTAGLLYHLGTFFSMFLFFFIITGHYPGGWPVYFMIAFLVMTSFSGSAILIKRIIRKELRFISNPDDFISNFLVTLFQILTITVLFLTVLQSYSPTVLQSYHPTVLQSYRPTVLQSYSPAILLIYYIEYTVMMLYIPIGKLRHTIYFFAARYHLGFFFGRRGVWPSGKIKS